MRIWRIEHDVWTNPWGDRVSVDRVVEGVDVVQAGAIPKNNGYHDYEARVYVDLPTGRVWWKPQTIDYWGTPYLTRVGRDPDVPETWVDRLPLRSAWKDGTPVTPELRDRLNEARGGET